METIKISRGNDGKLVPVDGLCRILVIAEENDGRFLIRASGWGATFRYNVAMITGERRGEAGTTVYELEPLLAITQREIFERASSSPPMYRRAFIDN